MIKEILQSYAKKTEDKCGEYFKEYSKSYETLADSMQYSLNAGGKRVRPFLTIAFCKLFSGEEDRALPFAAALEMIHTSSLIHDDMPCMDNDKLRRGKPTNHVVYGEDTALLAGDGLIALAFEAVAGAKEIADSLKVKAMGYLADCIGYRGMMGGQMIDLESEGRMISYESLCELQSLKTGRLIRAACVLGVLAAGVEDENTISDTVRYADGIGKAFQIIDDILDVTSDEKTMGKSLSDVDNNKITFLSFMSVEEARDEARKLTEDAISAIAKYEGSEVLREFAKMLFERKK